MRPYIYIGIFAVRKTKLAVVRTEWGICREGVGRVPINSPWFALCVFSIASMATQNRLHASSDEREGTSGRADSAKLRTNKAVATSSNAATRARNCVVRIGVRRLRSGSSDGRNDRLGANAGARPSSTTPLPPRLASDTPRA